MKCQFRIKFKIFEVCFLFGDLLINTRNVAYRKSRLYTIDECYIHVEYGNQQGAFTMTEVWDIYQLTMIQILCIFTIMQRYSLNSL